MYVYMPICIFMQIGFIFYQIINFLRSLLKNFPINDIIFVYVILGDIV